MFCEKCGTQLNGQEKFCPKCGNPIEIEKEVKEPIEKIEKSSHAKKVKRHKNEKTRKKKSKIKRFFAIFGIVILVAGATAGSLYYRWYTSPEQKDLRKWYSDAEEMYHNEDYQDALEQYQKIIEKDSGYKDVKNKLSECIDELRKEILNKAKEFADEEDFEKAMNELSNALIILRNDEKIQEKCNEYKQSYIDNMCIKADTEVSNGDYSAAISKIEDAIEVVGNEDSLEEKRKELENEYEQAKSNQQQINLVKNSGFETGDESDWEFENYSTEVGESVLGFYNVGETGGDAKAGNGKYSGQFWSNVKQDYKLTQKIDTSDLIKGIYCAEVYCEGGIMEGPADSDSTIQLYVSVGDSIYVSENAILSGWGDWNYIKMENIPISRGDDVEIGIFIDCAEDVYGKFDDFSLKLN